MKKNNGEQIWNRNRVKLLTGLGSLIAFAVISYIVNTSEVLAFDTIIREFIYDLRNDYLTAFFRTLTCLGNWQTITLLCILCLLIFPLTKSFGIPLSASAIIAVLIQKTLKTYFHRARPDIALHLIEQGGYSFPSGHSFSVLVFYGMVIYLCRKNIKNRTIANTVTVLLSCLIFLIGFSRIYLGVHFPTDVLGGWSLGLCLFMLLTSGLNFLLSYTKK